MRLILTTSGTTDRIRWHRRAFHRLLSLLEWLGLFRFPNIHGVKRRKNV